MKEGPDSLTVKHSPEDAVIEVQFLFWAIKYYLFFYNPFNRRVAFLIIGPKRINKMQLKPFLKKRFVTKNGCGEIGIRDLFRTNCLWM
jgi:hypothetical protein